MAFKSPENVQETTTTTGTGTITLAGAVSGRFAFSSQLANGDTLYYTISDGTDLESGIGTYTNTSGQQLSRDTVLYSTNGNAKVNWAAGTRNVVASLPGAAIRDLIDPNAKDFSSTTLTFSVAQNADSTPQDWAHGLDTDNVVFGLTFRETTNSLATLYVYSVSAIGANGHFLTVPNDAGVYASDPRATFQAPATGNIRVNVRNDAGLNPATIEVNIWARKM